jgi:TolB-like protein/Tfp pilus assembly protein PilF
MENRRLNELNIRPDIPESSIREELGRILSSPLFAQSERLSRFLRYAVNAVLAGKSDSLKEFVIGTEVYEREPPYHPSQDTIVRTEARRLRAKLREYYASEGRADPVLIYFRPGSYVPAFRRGNVSAGSDPAAPQSYDHDLYAEGRGLSIAVVPFEGNSEERLSSACAIAITDELIHQLMRTEGCRVMSANAATPLEKHTSDLPELANKLGIDLFFEGSVRQEGMRLRVTARIIARDGFQIWSQRFETQPEPDHIFDISEQIVLSLINRTCPELSWIRKLKTSAGAGIMKHYPAVLTAEFMIDEGTAADTAMAILKLEEVLQAVPEYPRPLCDIAQASYELALQGVDLSAAQILDARMRAEKACTLDSEMVRAHSCIGALSVLAWDFTAGDTSFQRALKLGSHAVVYRQYALFLLIQKRLDEAWSYLQRALQMDPFSHRQKTACARFCFLSRRYSQIDNILAQHDVYGPLPVEVRLYQALVYIELGRIDEARVLARELRHRSGDQPTVAATLAEVLARCGDIAEGNELVTGLALLSPVPGISNFRKSLLTVASGNEAAALSLLEAGCDGHDPEMIWLHVDPRFDSLRTHPRFDALAQRIPVPQPRSSSL